MDPLFGWFWSIVFLVAVGGGGGALMFWAVRRHYRKCPGCHICRP